MKKKNQKKYQSVITKRIVQSMHRLTVAVLFLAVFSGVISIGGTNAGFSDLEESTGNIFSASSLDGEATYIERFSVTGMNPEQSPDKRIIFSNVGKLDFRYGVKYRKTSGDDILCNTFLLTVKRNEAVVPVYTGLLKDFNINQFPSGSPFQIARFGEDTWDFTVELPANADGTIEHKTCQWDFDFTAWQTNLPDATQGFSDAESVGTHSIATGEWLTAGDVVINEVMWMGSTASTADEWIELKNMTSKDMLLEGWKIENAGPSNGTITLPSGAFIPANGYYLIANYAQTDVLSALNVTPDYVVNLVLNDSGNGNLVLKNNTVTPLVIDSALGTPVWPAGTNATFNQSMERNPVPVPGDGTVAGSWHTCASGNCNDGIYWNTADGNNFGTPGAANLSPVVMNEFVVNPDGSGDQWVELYNMLDEDMDVAGWYFKNGKGDTVIISADTTDSKETIVPKKGMLVVNLGKDFLDGDKDTLSFYDGLKTPEDESDDVKEDVYTYENASVLPVGKTFARFPNGVGIWVDPEATPGKENQMPEEEMKNFRLMAYDACFAGEKLKKDNTEAICSPIFLTYIGMLNEADDTKITDSAILEILEMMRLAEEKKLVALLAETAVIDTKIALTTDTPIVENPEPVEGNTPIDESVPAEEDVPVVTDEVITPEEVVPVPEPTPTEPVVTPEKTPVEIPTSVETATVPEEAPVVKEDPPVEATPPVAKTEETPAVVPEETPIIETPVN